MDMMLTDTNVGLNQGAKHDSTDLLGAADAPSASALKKMEVRLVSSSLFHYLEVLSCALRICGGP